MKHLIYNSLLNEEQSRLYEINHEICLLQSAFADIISKFEYKFGRLSDETITLRKICNFKMEALEKEKESLTNKGIDYTDLIIKELEHKKQQDAEDKSEI